MRVVQINATCGIGSTGKIACEISRCMTENDIQNKILFSSGSSDYELSVKCSDRKYINIQALKSHLLGNYGFNSKKLTEKIITQLDDFSPDIVHLHNIHGHDCNLNLLFKYLKKRKTKVVWTFHDCWAFTGYCPHFTMIGCDKWKTVCGDCPQRKDYSYFFDRSTELFLQKKELFSDIDLTVVTPSKWLADLVRQSFLKHCNIKVINNGIDLSVFRPRDSKFRAEYGLTDKKILLGVAFGWGVKKGLDVFVDISQKLNDEYKIVLVGTDKAVEKQLPKNILSISRTHNQPELAEIYTAADVLLNLSREENYPTVNMEALACGTPVITFNVGGSVEMLADNCGYAVAVDDIDSLLMRIKDVCEHKRFSSEACVHQAEEFDNQQKFNEYIELYEEIYERITKG